MHKNYIIFLGIRSKAEFHKSTAAPMRQNAKIALMDSSEAIFVSLIGWRLQDFPALWQFARPRHITEVSPFRLAKPVTPLKVLTNAQFPDTANTSTASPPDSVPVREADVLGER